MRATIAHISDVHFESIDDGVQQKLTTAVARLAPQFIVFTGDLVNNFWEIKKGKQWLIDVCQACGINPKTRLLVVPGNHDYRLWGTFGFRPLTSRPFRRHFQDFIREPIKIFPKYHLSFLHFDSNPIVRGFAQGHVSRAQLRRMQAAIASLLPGKKSIFSNSTKFALVHHHPLPVPFEDSDTFLMLNRSQQLIQFLAEHRVNLVLHGHKHRASNSLLQIGTCAGDYIDIRVLGAGAAVNGATDHDPRGHNFNIITVEDNGLIIAEQYFAKPGKDFAKEQDGLLRSRVTVDTKAARLPAAYKCRHLHWDCKINADGDTFNEIWREDLRSANDSPVDTLPTRAYSCTTGHLSELRLISSSPERVTLAIESAEQREIKFLFRFKPPVTSQDPVTFGVRSWDFNAVALDKRSFGGKYPGNSSYQEHETEFLTEVTDHFSWTLVFPEKRKPDGVPRFEVLDELKILHPQLTALFSEGFHYSLELGIATLGITSPPTGYQYRISWRLPDGPVKSATNPAHIAEVERFGTTLLHEWTANGGLSLEVHQVLAAALGQVMQKIESNLRTPGVIRLHQLDVSLMIYDNTERCDVPKLRTVAAMQGEIPKVSDLLLEVGDGVAGRAYKTNSHRFYDGEKAASEIGHGYYITQSERTRHSFLHSIPLRHRKSQQLLYGILNIGTYNDTQGKMLRTLADRAGIEWLIELGQNYVLRRLEEIVNNRR